MADITMCSGHNCPLKGGCYRYTAPQGMWQSFFSKVPYDVINNICEHYWKDTSKLKDKSESRDKSQ